MAFLETDHSDYNKLLLSDAVNNLFFILLFKELIIMIKAIIGHVEHLLFQYICVNMANVVKHKIYVHSFQNK